MQPARNNKVRMKFTKSSAIKTSSNFWRIQRSSLNIGSDLSIVILKNGVVIRQRRSYYTIYNWVFVCRKVSMLLLPHSLVCWCVDSNRTLIHQILQTPE